MPPHVFGFDYSKSADTSHVLMSCIESIDAGRLLMSCIESIDAGHFFPA
jgi:hypothetical protein